MPFIEVHVPNHEVKRYDVSASFLPQDPGLSWEVRARERETVVNALLALFKETMIPAFDEAYVGVKYFFVMESKADPSKYLENAIDEYNKIKQIT